MVGATVNAINDNKGGAGELVIEATRGQTPDHASAVRFTVHHEAGGAASKPLLAKRIVQPRDDVSAALDRAKARFGVVRKLPTTRTERLRQTEPLQLTYAPDLEAMLLVRLFAKVRSQINDTVDGRSVQSAIEPGPSIGRHLPRHAHLDLVIGARPQLKRRTFACPRT